jgi:hypothetical protein
MRNWDYGVGYSGPTNAGDVAKLAQVITASTKYVESDLTLKNTGSTTKSDAILEMPTFYFKPDYRKYHVKYAGSGSVSTITVPDRLDNLMPLTNTQLGMDSSGFKSGDVTWISFENVKGTANDSYTIAWFYKNALRADIEATASQYAFQVLETDYYRDMKFSNAPRFNLQPSTSKTYNFKYVIFPYRYDQTISSLYGTMTVENVIAQMKAAYEN